MAAFLLMKAKRTFFVSEPGNVFLLVVAMHGDKTQQALIDGGYLHAIHDNTGRSNSLQQTNHFSLFL